MATDNSTLPRTELPRGARFVKAGSPVPKGRIVIPMWPGRINYDGTPYTLGLHLFFCGAEPTKFIKCEQGKHGALATFLLADGESRSMYVNTADLAHPALQRLTKSDRGRLAKQLAKEGGAAS